MRLKTSIISHVPEKNVDASPLRRCAGPLQARGGRVHRCDGVGLRQGAADDLLHDQRHVLSMYGGVTTTRLVSRPSCVKRLGHTNRGVHN